MAKQLTKPRRRSLRGWAKPGPPAARIRYFQVRDRGIAGDMILFVCHGCPALPAPARRPGRPGPSPTDSDGPEPRRLPEARTAATPAVGAGDFMV